MLSIEKNQMMIEHYREVVSVSDVKICIQLDTYQIEINGVDLRILALAASEIYLAGKLEGIRFLYEK